MFRLLPKDSKILFRMYHASGKWEEMNTPQDMIVDDKYLDGGTVGTYLHFNIKKNCFVIPRYIDVDNKNILVLHIDTKLWRKI